MSFWRATSRAGFVLVVSLLWMGVMIIPNQSFAVAPTPLPGPDNIVENPYGFKMSQTEQEAYFAVVDEGCSTPSLECLVHNVSQFTAFEWINNILGPSQLSFLGGGAPETGVPTNTPVASRGAVGGLVSMVGSMYSNPAASSGKYVADVLESAHVVTPAYAQGLGFAALDPTLALWKTFRNIAYIFFVIIFVVIGFMIMFRQKMGQTAITAQQAIPRIILALILVTFSYAIAGFAIDLMYLTMTMIIGVFGKVFPAGDSILGYNILDLMGRLISSVSDFGSNINLVQNIVAGFAGQESDVTEFVGFLGGTALTFILALAVLIGTVRLFFEMLKSYAIIVLSVVISPMLIMLDAIPGKKNFQTWLKTLIGHLSVFPVVLMVVVMFYSFTDGTVRATGGFMPPFLLGSGMSGNITSLMGLAIILAMPDIVKSIRDNIAPKNAFAGMITTGAMKSGKDALRYSPLPAGAAGYAAGAVEGLYDNRKKLTHDPFGTIRSMGKYGAARATQYASAARSVSRTAEQLVEGKAVDPNAWENTLVNEQRAADKKRKKEAIEKLKAAAVAPPPSTPPP